MKRERFEAWCQEQGFSTEQTEEGIYDDHRAYVAWEAIQAAEPKCKDCRHWDSNAPDYGVCAESLVLLMDVIPDAMHTPDGSVFTGPEFGCIKFEAKEPA